MKARQTEGEYQAATEEFISKCGHRWMKNTASQRNYQLHLLKQNIYPQHCAYQSPACKKKKTSSNTGHVLPNPIQNKFCVHRDISAPNQPVDGATVAAPNNSSSAGRNCKHILLKHFFPPTTVSKPSSSIKHHCSVLFGENMRNSDLLLGEIAN